MRHSFKVRRHFLLPSRLDLPPRILVYACALFLFILAIPLAMFCAYDFKDRAPLSASDRVRQGLRVVCLEERKEHEGTLKKAQWMLFTNARSKSRLYIPNVHRISFGLAINVQHKKYKLLAREQYFVTR